MLVSDFCSSNAIASCKPDLRTRAGRMSSRTQKQLPLPPANFALHGVTDEAGPNGGWVYFTSSAKPLTISVKLTSHLNLTSLTSANMRLPR